MPTTEFHFDFGSPNAYLAHQMMPALQQRIGQTVDYVPVLLGGLFKLAHNRSPVEAYAEIPNKLAYERLEMRRFIQRHGLTAFRFNPHFPVNTLKVMRGAVAARRLGCFAPYVDAVYAAMWEHGRNLSDDAEIASVLQAAGLDPTAIAALSQDAEVKAELLANTERSHARGAFGSPTFFVGDEIFFGKDSLADLEDEIVRRKAG